MTYETGTASDLEDLLSKLSTFAVTTHGGWTAGYSPNPDTTNRWFEIHKSGVSFGIRYPVAPRESVSVHQALTYLNSSTAPGAHTDDSGNGYNVGSGGSNANFETERCVRDIGDGPFLSYHFFADDTGAKDYVHCVVQPTAGMFRHFGVSLLNKRGDWTGGWSCWGHYQASGTSTSATSSSHQVMLDGLGGATDDLRSATVHIEGLPNQNASSKWGVSVAIAESSIPNDTAGNPRYQIHGGFRAGMEARGFSQVIGTSSSGVVGLYSIAALYRDPSNPRVYPLGYLDDVRAFNTRNFEPEEELVIGSDTWVLFPMSIRTQSLVENRSQYLGVAYRKVP